MPCCSRSAAASCRSRWRETTSPPAAWSSSRCSAPARKRASAMAGVRRRGRPRPGSQAATGAGAALVAGAAGKPVDARRVARAPWQPRRRSSRGGEDRAQARLSAAAASALLLPCATDDVRLRRPLRARRRPACCTPARSSPHSPPGSTRAPTRVAGWCASRISTRRETSPAQQPESSANSRAAAWCPTRRRCSNRPGLALRSGAAAAARRRPGPIPAPVRARDLERALGARGAGACTPRRARLSGHLPRRPARQGGALVSPARGRQAAGSTYRLDRPATRPATAGCHAQVGDFVLKRADGLWAYQLGVVVDDAEQGVTDVVRGEDLADNTARQIQLQRSLGLPTPRYLHTPLVLAEGGEKLSKQTGAGRCPSPRHGSPSPRPPPCWRCIRLARRLPSGCPTPSRAGAVAGRFPERPREASRADAHHRLFRQREPSPCKPRPPDSSTKTP